MRALAEDGGQLGRFHQPLTEESRARDSPESSRQQITSPTPSDLALPRSKLTSRQMALLPPFGCTPSMRTFLPGQLLNMKLPSRLVSGAEAQELLAEGGDGTKAAEMRSQRSPDAGRSMLMGGWSTKDPMLLDTRAVESASGSFALVGMEEEDGDGPKLEFEKCARYSGGTSAEILLNVQTLAM